jgi:hypothetical protein
MLQQNQWGCSIFIFQKYARFKLHVLSLRVAKGNSEMVIQKDIVATTWKIHLEVQGCCRAAYLGQDVRPWRSSQLFL